MLSVHATHSVEFFWSIGPVTSKAVMQVTTQRTRFCLLRVQAALPSGERASPRQICFDFFSFDRTRSCLLCVQAALPGGERASPQGLEELLLRHMTEREVRTRVRPALVAQEAAQLASEYSWFGTPSGGTPLIPGSMPKVRSASSLRWNNSTFLRARTAGMALVKAIILKGMTGTPSANSGVPKSVSSESCWFKRVRQLNTETAASTQLSISRRWRVRILAPCPPVTAQPCALLCLLRLRNVRRHCDRP